MKMLKNYWKTGSLVLLLIFLFPCFISTLEAQENNTPDITASASSEMPAPEFSLQDLSGDTVSLKDYRGKIVVMHIATTWCPFCNAEAPHLEKLYQDYKERDVEVLIIDVKEPGSLVKEKLKDKYDLSFPVLLDPEGKVAASYAPQDVLPDLARDEVMLASNLIIDREGMIQFMSLLDTRNFDAELVQLKKKLNEML